MKSRKNAEMLDQAKIELTIEEKPNMKMEESKLKYSENGTKDRQLMNDEEGK